MDHQPLSSLLQEANSLAQGHYDIEPISVENTEAKFTVHKAGKTNNLVKKTWRKPKDKPKRPLSAYNLFFQHEREKIITSNPDISLEETLIKISNTPKPKKRRHRKSHGMIGFADLARTIAEKWKTLDSTDRAIYESRAGEEKQRYRKELEAWSKARDEKAKEDEKKSPLELARVEVVYDDHLEPFRMNGSPEMSMNVAGPKPGLSMDSLSSLLMSTPAGPHHNSPPHHHHHHHSHHHHTHQQPQDVRDYLKMTQQTIDMARASLSLPLFANIGVNQMGGMGGNMMQPQHEPAKFHQPTTLGSQLGTQLGTQLGGQDFFFPPNNSEPYQQQGRLSASMLSGMMERHPKNHY